MRYRLLPISARLMLGPESGSQERAGHTCKPTTHSPDGKRPSSCKYLVCSYTLPLAKLPGIGFTHTCDLCLLITPMGLPQPWHRTRSSLAPYDNKAASPTALLAVAARTPAPSPKKKYTGPAATARPRSAIVSHGLTDPVAGPSTNSLINGFFASHHLRVPVWWRSTLAFMIATASSSSSDRSSEPAIPST